MIKHPVSTEKAIRMMESDNKLMFMVDRSMNKHQIKKELEERFEIKITAINTMNTFKGKKAIVTLSPDVLAIDVATKLGLM